MNGLEILQNLKDYQQMEKDCYDVWNSIIEIKPNDEEAKKYKSIYVHSILLLELIINKIEEKMEDEYIAY